MTQPQPGPYQPGPYAPIPPQRPPGMSTGVKVLIGIGAAFAFLFLLGIVGTALGGDDGKQDDTAAGTSVKEDDKPVAEEEPAKEEAKEKSQKEEPAEEEPKPEAKPEKSQADQFKECVAKNGTPTEKTAVEHVTKVTGADKQNDFLDTAEVFTDYSGGMFGPHGSDGKLIATAFASCYESENGLVTVYDKNAEILSNGNY